MTPAAKGFLNVLSMQEVTARLTAFPPLPPMTGKAALPLTDDRLLTGNLVLAEDILATEDLPPAHRSGMDGYAVLAADLFGASDVNPVWLDCVGNIAIDRPPCFTLSPGQCAAIVTGGFLPQGADAVIMVEQTSEFGAGVIEMRRSVAPGEYVLRKGEDAALGKVVLAAGTLLRPQELGLLAGLGISQVPVFRRPRIVVLSTGDELVPPHVTPRSGQIRDINSLTLTAMLRRADYAVEAGGIIPDSLAELTTALKERVCSEPPPDVIFLSGGSSVGVRDFTLEALTSLGDTDIFCHGVALSPGKPLIIARCGSTFIWGLPGQVTSAQVVMLVLGLPFLRHLSGHKAAFDQSHWLSRPARLSRNIASRQGREDYVRVRLQPSVSTVQGKESGRGDLTRRAGLEQINFEIVPISKLAFCQKTSFSAESTPRCGGCRDPSAEHFQSENALAGLAGLAGPGRQAGQVPDALPVPGLSGLLRTLLEADGVVRIPARLEGLEAGTVVNVLLFSEY